MINISREDARQAPKTKGKTPGQPCGGGWISANYQCSPDKVKQAANLLKGKDEKSVTRKSRFTQRMRNAKGLTGGDRTKQRSQRLADKILPKYKLSEADKATAANTVLPFKRSQALSSIAKRMNDSDLKKMTELYTRISMNPRSSPKQRVSALNKRVAYEKELDNRMAENDD